MIYLSIFDLQRSFLLPVDLNAEGVEVEPEEPWHQVQVHRRQGGRARVSNEGAIKLFSRRTFPLRVDTPGSRFLSGSYFFLKLFFLTDFAFDLSHKWKCIIIKILNRIIKERKRKDSYKQFFGRILRKSDLDIMGL